MSNRMSIFRKLLSLGPETTETVNGKLRGSGRKKQAIDPAKYKIVTVMAK